MTKSYMTFQYSLEETIEELQEHITSLKSLLSKSEEENKELKEQIGTPDMFYYPDDPELPHGSIEELMEFADIGTPTLIKPYKLIEHENEWCIKNEDGSYPLFTTKEEALSSLNKSKGEEE